jgi:hypothetical protein
MEVHRSIAELDSDVGQSWVVKVGFEELRKVLGPSELFLQHFHLCQCDGRCIAWGCRHCWAR